MLIDFLTYSKTQQQTWLPDTRVSNQQKLEKVVTKRKHNTNANNPFAACISFPDANTPSTHKTVTTEEQNTTQQCFLISQTCTIAPCRSILLMNYAINASSKSFLPYNVYFHDKNKRLTRRYTQTIKHIRIPCVLLATWWKILNFNIKYNTARDKKTPD